MSRQNISKTSTYKKRLTTDYKKRELKHN